MKLFSLYKAPGPIFGKTIKALAILFLLLLSSVAAQAQNTKGDKPVPNQRQLRENKFKRVKKPKRVKTRDISGRRLRTLNKSSASRANRKWTQPDPYSDRRTTRTDRAAAPRGRIFNTRPSDRQRAWKGDISGHKIRIQSEKSRSARNKNVYPQSGPFVNNPSKEPRSKPRVYTRTASGKKPVKRTPQARQRAWKGNIQGGPVGTPSRSGQYRKIYPQKGPFVNHYSKSGRDIQRTYPNKNKINSAAKRESARPPGRQYGIYPRSASGPFIFRGRKNVYWGKFSKGEKPFTRDIAGRPLRTRNFKSTPAGLISRDTLKFFGRRPGGDRAYRGSAGGFGTVRGNQKLKGGGFKSISGKRTNRNPLPPRAPGIGADGINYSGRLRRGLQPGFGKQGAGYSGNIKSRRQPKGGGSVSGRVWNNRQNPIPVRTPKGGAGVAGYQGSFRRGELQPGFSPQGAGFAGNIKAKRPVKGGGSVSGRLWNNRNTPIPVRTPRGGQGIGDYSGTFRRGELQPGFSKQGADFSGNIKTRRPAKGGGSVSGKLWNNRNTPIPVRTPRGGEGIGDYSGTFRRGELQPGFTKQGADFAGNIKTRRPEKGGGSVSGKLWNNKNTPIPVRTPRGGKGIGDYSGTFRRGELQPGFTKQGADFAGNIKTKRPEKGGGSVSGKVWNNKNTPIPGRTPSDEARKAAGYPGNYKMFDLHPSRMYQGEEFTGYIKAKRPKKGGGSISGDLWNNNESPIAVRTPKGDAAKAGNFSGNIKATRPKKGGGSISGKLWNNNEEPIQVRIPLAKDAKTQDYAGRIKLSGFRRNYVQNPNAVDESIKKQRPDKSTFEVAGLQVKVQQRQYKDKPYAAKGSLPGVAPTKSSMKAGVYAKGVKMNWSYKHNPNSADDALKGREPNKAYAKIGDYQGNIKMKKYGNGDFHPDSKFAHGFRDNVKEERTILMNIKLMWAKLFRKSETQPDHLKERERRPRYDKREKGLWYE
ncbi:MAG: hypothetical protein AB7O48_04225 [Cyclobacteriaceae bacterium]